MTKKESREVRVEAILSAAVDVFIEKGYESASVNEIAARAGVSKGGLYHHFLSKDMILLHANKKLMEPIDELMKIARDNPSPSDGLRFYIHDYIKYWVSHKKELIFFSLSMTKAMGQKDIFKMYEKYTENYIGFFEQLYKNAVAAGELISHDTRSNAIALMSALDGVIIYAVLDRKLGDDDTVKRFQNIFIDQLNAKK